MHVCLEPHSADGAVMDRHQHNSNPTEGIVNAASLHSALTWMLPVMGCCTATVQPVHSSTGRAQPSRYVAEGLCCCLYSWVMKRTMMDTFCRNRCTCEPGLNLCTSGELFVVSMLVVPSEAVKPFLNSHILSSFKFSRSKVLLVLLSFGSSLSCLTSLSSQRSLNSYREAETIFPWRLQQNY